MRASRDWRSARYLAAQRRSKARRDAQQRASKAQGRRATGEDVRVWDVHKAQLMRWSRSWVKQESR